MLILASDLNNKTIFSLETGNIVATVDQPIIDPNSLKVVAFKLKMLDDPAPRVVFADDIRESDVEGFSVDGYKNLVELDSHLVRLQKIIALNFDILELKVEDGYGKKLGQITDYVVKDSDFEITRFYYRTRDLRGRVFSQDKFFVRGSILKLSNKRIIIN